MIINHNLAANNAIRNANINQSTASKSMQKLSSGLRINSASDDAAGLAISEKMKGQIRGLDQASSNAQDGISMIQTAEGALGETQSILQRMRELAVQSSTDTNTADDRSKIQSETDELAKEITRISNDTEFNTQKLINGAISDSGIKSATFHVGANAGQGITLSIGAMDAKTLGVSRDVSTGTLDSANAAKVNTAKVDATDVTKALAAGDYKATVAATAAGTTAVSSTGNVSVASGASIGTASADTKVVLTRTAAIATAATAIAGSGTATAITATGAGDLLIKIDGTAVTVALANNDSAASAVTKVNTAVNAKLGTTGKTYAALNSGVFTLSSLTTGTGSKTEVTSATGSALTSLGLTAATSNTGSAGAASWVATGDKTGTIVDAATTLLANGVSVDTTNITGMAVGDTVTISGTKDAGTSVQLFASDGTTAIGSAVNISTTNGGNYTVGNATTGQAKVNFAAGAATIGTSTITVSTTGATVSKKESDDAMSTSTTSGGINVSTQSAASSAITTIQSAIETVSAERSKLGAYQNRLEHTINNLGTSSENLTSAQSRIADVDMAKEMSNFSKNNILSQAAQAMLAQANQQPQQVLQLLR